METPLLFTLRSTQQGGRFTLDADVAFEILLAAAKSGCTDLIDVEYGSFHLHAQTLVEKIRAFRCEALCSRHVFHVAPTREELYEILCGMKAAGAKAVKLAAMNQKELFAAVAHFKKESPETVLIAMALGETGALSRLIGEASGSAAAFASASSSKQTKTDPGQLSAVSTKKTIAMFQRTYTEALSSGLPALTPDTKLFAFLGTPLKQALSPRILNQLFIKNGLPCFYFPIETRKDELDTVFIGLRAANISGFAVTKPYKTDVVRYLDELDTSVSHSGACNTVANRNGKWYGFNTDGIACVEALCHEGGVTIQGETFLCIGAGGTARAVCFELAKRKAKRIYIVSRSASSFALAEEFNKSFPGLFSALKPSDENYLAVAPHCGVILNLSGCGMRPNAEDTPFPKVAFHSSQVCFDAVYDPSPTRFLREAHEADCSIINGLGMLKRTVEMQLTIWTKS
jgi:shikimate dehydrogenase/3-dehydroquinate dehydratase type I